MSFQADAADEVDSVFLTTELGEAATYTSQPNVPGGSATDTAITTVFKDLTDLNEETARNYGQREFKVSGAVIASPKPGDRITLGAEVYEVIRIEKTALGMFSAFARVLRKR